MPMETVVVVAIATLSVVFVGSLSALILICYHRYYRKDLFTKLTDADNLIPGHGAIPNHMELDDVQIHPEIDRILADAQWVDDASGFITHCLAILKSCHQLTERLVGATMSMMPQFEEGDQKKKLWEIIRVAQRISPHVDAVIAAMYPPLDPRLLESRSQSLVLSVTQLAMVIRYMCHIRSNWIEDCLTELEQEIKGLREAGLVLLSETMSTGGGPVSPRPPSALSGGITNPACTADTDHHHSHHSRQDTMTATQAHITSIEVPAIN